MAPERTEGVWRQTLAAAQPLDGPLMARFRGLARDSGLWLSLGGFQECGPDPGHTYNTHVILDATGATVAAYRKARSPALLSRSLFNTVPGSAMLERAFAQLRNSQEAVSSTA